jgi:hypothetical protein
MLIKISIERDFFGFTYHVPHEMVVDFGNDILILNDKDFCSKYNSYLIDDEYDYNNPHQKLYSYESGQLENLVYVEYEYFDLWFIPESCKDFYIKNGWCEKYLIPNSIYEQFVIDVACKKYTDNEIYKKYSKYIIGENLIDLYIEK